MYHELKRGAFFPLGAFQKQRGAFSGGLGAFGVLWCIDIASAQ